MNQENIVLYNKKRTIKVQIPLERWLEEIFESAKLLLRHGETPQQHAKCCVLTYAMRVLEATEIKTSDPFIPPTKKEIQEAYLRSLIDDHVYDALENSAYSTQYDRWVKGGILSEGMARVVEEAVLDATSKFDRDNIPLDFMDEFIAGKLADFNFSTRLADNVYLKVERIAATIN